VIIRASDLAGGVASSVAATTAWTRAAEGPSRAASLGSLAMFECAAGETVRISADVGSGARGLTVEQHAGRVLDLLRGAR
jgi:hypothetical protein